MLPRFVDGRPVSQVTTDYLAWVCGGVGRGKASTVLLLVWDNASWHISHCVRAWPKEQYRRTKREGGGAAARVPPAEQESVAELD